MNDEQIMSRFKKDLYKNERRLKVLESDKGLTIQCGCF